MAVLPVNWYGTVLRDVEDGVLDLEAVTLTVSWHGLGYTPDTAQTTTAELADEAAGTGYSQKTITGVQVTITRTLGVATVFLTADPTTYTGVVPSARWIVVRSGTRLLWWGDPGQIMNANGGDVTIRWQLQSASGAPWSTSALVNSMVFHSSQNQADHETYEALMGRTVLFSLRWLTGGWASSARPTSWAPSKSAYQSYLSATNSFRVNRPDITQVFTCPILYGTQTLDQALVSAAGETFWTEFGAFCLAQGLVGRKADGRPHLILRVGWELDGNWYPWGLRFNGGTVAANAPKFKALFDQSHAWFNAGAGAGAGDVLWTENFMASNQHSAASLALALADTADIYSNDSYDDMAGGAFYGSAAATKTQPQKDAAFPTVWNAIINGSVGRNWLVAQCVAKGKLYAIDEGSVYFDQPAGERPEAGGDHAFPAVSWFRTELDWFNTPGTGPQALGILAYHCIYNAETSGVNGSTLFVPEQSYAPNSYDAWLAAYHP